MAQQFGLGRGLSSLIPNKQPTDATADDFSRRTISAADESIRGDKFVIDVDASQIITNCCLRINWRFHSS